MVFFSVTSENSNLSIYVWTKIEHSLKERKQQDKNETLNMANTFSNKIFDQNDEVIALNIFCNIYIIISFIVIL